MFIPDLGTTTKVFLSKIANVFLRAMHFHAEVLMFVLPECL